MRRMTLIALVMGAAVALAACSDGQGNGEPDAAGGICSGPTLTVAPQPPNPSAGFAPLRVDFEVQVSLIENIQYSWVIDFGDGTESSGTNSQPSSIHEYVDEGEFVAKVTVRDDTCNKTETVEIPISVQAPVELRGQELTARPGNVEVGEEIQLTLGIVNDADSDLTLPVSSAFFLSQRPGVLWGELPTLIPLTNVTLNPPDDGGPTIEGGGSRTVSTTVVIPATVISGTYYVIGAIDPNQLLNERDDNERNNLVTSNAPVFVQNSGINKPDFRVEGVRIGPDTAFMELLSISINVDLINEGTIGDEGSYGVYAQLGDAPLDPGATPDFISEPVFVNFEPIPDNRFAVRAQQIVLTDPIALPMGQDTAEVYVWVCADPEDVFEEDNEDNNCILSENAITISNTPPEGVDIVLTSFDLSPTNTFLNGTVQVQMVVSNIGDTDSRSFFCSAVLSEDENLDLDDFRLANINISRLDAQETQTISQVVGVPGFIDIGTYTAFGVCDASNVVNETFEDNNVRRLEDPVSITPEAIIDLFVTSASFDPLDLDDGSEFTADFTVQNTGTNGSGPTELFVYRSVDSTCNSLDERVGTIFVPSLSPNATQDLTLTVPALTCDIFQGQYTLCFEIDPNNTIPEVDEDNNTGISPDPLNIRGDRCLCAEDFFEPNDGIFDAVPVSSGTVEDLTICAPEEQDFFAVDLEPGDSLRVQVSQVFSGACSNLDLLIFDPTSLPVEDGESATDAEVEEVELFLIQRAGRYTIRVQGQTDCDVNEYALTVEVTTPGPGIDLTGDELVPNDLNPALGQAVEATFTTLNIANDDAGAYNIALYLSLDDTVDTLLDFELARETIDDGLIGARIREDTVAFNIPVEATGGTYYVCAVLDSDNDLDEVNEDNNVVCSEPIVVDTECYDPFEVNDTPEAATVIEPGVLENVNVCNDGRQDFYRFTAPSDSLVRVRADFVHAQGDIELKLLRTTPGFPEIASSIGVRDFEEITLDYINGEQEFLVQVFLNDRNNNSNNYTLSINIEPGDPLNRCDGVLEPNDSIDEATDLFAAVNEEPVLDRCPQNDFDFYCADMVAGPTITLCADNDESNEAPYNLNLALFGPNQNQISANTGPNPCITQRLTSSGRYCVRVLSINPDIRAVRYNLSLEGLFGVDLLGRDFVATPADILPGSIEDPLRTSFTLANDRRDRIENIFYRIYYSTDAIIDPETDFQIGAGFIAALDGFSETLVEDVVLVPEDGPYVGGEGFIGVVLDPDNQIDEENEANNILSSAVNLLVCNEDDLEPNDSPGAGSPLVLGEAQADRAICPGSDDWYCADALPAGSYTIGVDYFLDPDDRLGSDLNLEVIRVDDVRSDLGRLGVDVSLADGASVSFDLDEETSICARVFPARSTGSNTYSVTLSER